MKAFTFTDIETVPSRMEPGREEVIVLGIGDIQADPALRGKPRSADLPKLKEAIQRGVDHGAYFIGMGDYVDQMSPSNQKMWAASGLYDTSIDGMDEIVHQTLDEVAEIMEIAKGRWLGLLTGHHHYKFQHDGDSDVLLAERLGTLHLGGGVAGLTLLLPPQGHHRRPVVKIMATHGRNSNARSPGAVTNELYRLAADYSNVDAIMIGHYHKQVGETVPKFDWRGGERGGTPRLVERQVALACTGSFMRGYVQDQREGARPLYPEVGLMSPLALGAKAVVARPVYESGDFIHNDMTTYDY